MKQHKILNLRAGFATNSSSSHSLIFDPTITRDDGVSDGEFGWGFFTAASDEAKRLYMATIFQSNVRRDLGAVLYDYLTKGTALETPVNSYIDHQSLYTIPKDFDGDLNVEFFEDFKAAVMKPGVVILGGNDNSDESHYSYDENKELKFAGYYPEMDSNIIARKDGEFWTIYNRYSGNRSTFSFNQDAKMEDFRPESPFLIDMKITDYCIFSCPYCYMGSTKNGEHGSYDRICNLLRNIAENEVFEIALGGGSTESHPRFLDILRVGTSYGITMNFTTKNIDWLELNLGKKDVVDSFGALAFSIDGTNKSAIDRIATLRDYHGVEDKKITIQTIPGAISKYDLEAILKSAHHHNIRVTLLGFKEVGRGTHFRGLQVKEKWKYNSCEDSWLNVIKQLHDEKQCPKISIDTTLASKFEKEILASGIPSWLFHTEEGRYSLFIDTVQDKFGPSSYHNDLLKDGKGLFIQDMFGQISPV